MERFVVRYFVDSDFSLHTEVKPIVYESKEKFLNDFNNQLEKCINTITYLEREGLDKFRVGDVVINMYDFYDVDDGVRTQDIEIFSIDEWFDLHFSKK